MIDTAAILDELKRLGSKLDVLLPKGDEVIVSRVETARRLNMSVRQLRKHVASGHIVAQPSGFYVGEIERFAKTPHAPPPRVLSKPIRERTSNEEADRGRAILKAMRRPKSR